ncbi:MAG: hypothetical protein RMZ42_18045 [Nostoc sp. DedQUE05]|uniref:hypothetical protein n=1 Tax=Nostoc sp. DedQUE05 TaxID=3075391 RepID=UPI002AD32F7F|nr:hypothetical protein [Nostoc sp. DedQUE05]MDZ8093810.1 hypothetical protein [Nostoc sp. DedQUE05]
MKNQDINSCWKLNTGDFNFSCDREQCVGGRGYANMRYTKTQPLSPLSGLPLRWSSRLTCSLLTFPL